MQQLAGGAAAARVASNPLLRWAAQGLRPGVEVWTHADATGVRVDGVAARDRLAVQGPVGPVAALVTGLLEREGHLYRPIGPEPLISGVCDMIDCLIPTAPFGWMHTAVTPRVERAAEPAGREDFPAIERLLTVALPHSLARPSRAGARTWWVLRDVEGVAACAADAWSAPDVGFLAGVATAPRTRGRGFGRAVAAYALAQLVHRYGCAVLMVEADNMPARRLYHSLGMTYTSLRAAAPRTT
jgi:ribosomal protein S18 acetylase RimI-like enzyme